ncbi:MAG: site-2 protease family protein [Ruminiclostridium sp.]|nr:site-2 protease family protein [Ruminiclostridium sp.]
MLDAIMSGSIQLIILQAFSLLVVLFVCQPVHEFSHALAAKLLGDDTAEMQGRLTLNPFAHLDLIGTIGIALLGIGWGKPVPVNPRRCSKIKNTKAAMAITSAAGPLSNLITAFIFVVIYKLILHGLAGLENMDMKVYIDFIFYTIIRIDIALGVFNLIMPLPPFDGSRIFLAFLPEKYYFKIMQYEQIILIVILMIMWTGILNRPFNFLVNGVYDFLFLITGFLN